MVLALSVVLLAFYWLWPFPVLTIRKDVTVDQKVYRAGDYLEYTFSYCKRDDLEAETHFSFVDSVVYSTPGMTMRSLPPGCHVATEGIYVPNLPSGRYKLEMVRMYQPTPLRRVMVQSMSNEFEIIGR